MSAFSLLQFSLWRFDSKWLLDRMPLLSKGNFFRIHFPLNHVCQSPPQEPQQGDSGPDDGSGLLICHYPPNVVGLGIRGQEKKELPFPRVPY